MNTRLVRRLLIVGAATGLACSEIAGFEDFHGKVDPGRGGEGAASGGDGAPSSGGDEPGFGGSPSGGSGNTAGAGESSGGVEPGAGGTVAGSSSQGAGRGGDSSGANGGGRGGSAPVDAAGAGGADLGEGGTVGGCDNQLVANAGFDLGRRDWLEESNYSDNWVIIVGRESPKLVAQGVTPLAGDYLAWLGGIPDDEFMGYRTRLTQAVTIPEEVTRLVVSGHAWIQTTETVPQLYDWAVLEFQDDGNVLWQVKAWSNLDASDGWVAFEESGSEGLDAFRGRTVTLFIEGRTDNESPTSFFLDSLRVVAECPHN